MSFRQLAINSTAIGAVHPTFFAGLKAEIPPRQGASRQQLVTLHVGGKVKMMVTVDTVRPAAIQALKLIQLSLYRILEGIRQQRIVENSGHGVPPEVSNHSAMMFAELGRHPGCGKRRRQVQMQPDIDSVLERDTRRAL